MIAERGLTLRSATMRPLWAFLRQSFPHTFEQPVELFDTLLTRPTPFVTLYNHLPRIHFWVKRSSPGVLVFYKPKKMCLIVGFTISPIINRLFLQKSINRF